MIPSEEQIIEEMARAFQEATIKPVTWVDAKRGCEAALYALLESLPELETDATQYSDALRKHKQLLGMKK